MIRNHLIRLPRIFVEDRQGRDLSCGEPTLCPPHQILCDVSTDELVDMADDAQYQGWETDSGDRSVTNSARRACQIIVAYMRDQGLELPKSCRRI